MWLDKAAHILDSATKPASRVVIIAGAGVLAAMMFLIAADVLLRYVFNSPISGALEVSEFMLVMVFFFSVPYVAVKKRHVAMDLVTSRLQPRVRAILDSSTSLLGLCLFALLTWRTVIYALWMEETGAVSHILRLSLLPFILLVAFGSALLCLVLLGDFLKSMTQALERSRRQVGLWVILGIALVLLLIAFPAWGHHLPWQVSPLAVGVIGIVALFLIFATEMPIGFVMLLVGFLGVAYLRGMDAGFDILGRIPYKSCTFTFCVLPLFILMGELAFHSRLSADLYAAMYKWIGRWPGGMAMATVAGCAGFAAICGDNASVAATMATVTLPEMKKYNYDPGLATGCIAGGGTLGVLIPPSLAFILYALLTEQSITALFLAGIFPGILLAALMMLTIYILTKSNPNLGPPGPKTSLRDKIVSLRGTWGILALFALVMGGIYFGVFTPTEGAGIGAFGALLYSIVTRRFTRQNFAASLLGASQTTALLIILVGAVAFGIFLTVSTLPAGLTNWAVALPVPPVVILIFILFILVILGCLMSAIAMLLLTVPIFYPVLIGLGYDPIWIGVIMVLMWNVACVTPPVGITVFVVKAVAPELPLYTIFRGIVPFFIAMIVCVAILIAFPQIATFLPNLMK